MRKNLHHLIIPGLLSLFVACAKDGPNGPAEVSIDNVTGETSVVQFDTVRLKAVGGNGFEDLITWSVDGEIRDTKDTGFEFVAARPGTYTVTLACGDAVSDINLHVGARFGKGTFILNEGNMTTENGSLIFIDPHGTIVDSAYWRVNGTFLGNVCQDLYITPDKKMYIISQNGRKNPVYTEFENDGMLVVANALTLEKEAAYDEELSELYWPTHIAVLGHDNVFIRDGRGIWLFNTLNKKLRFIDGSENTTKNTMAVIGSQVFAACGSKVLVLRPGQTTVYKTIEMGAEITGVVRSSDGNLWVATIGKPHKIAKISISDYSMIRQNDITAGSVSTDMMAATPGITAKGDILYFSGLGENIYRHDFNTGVTEFMVNAFSVNPYASIVYNTIAVHPVTGEVWMNTLKGFGWAFLKNNIMVFDFSGSAPRLARNYADYTHFPAGIFFTDNFN